MTLLILFKVFLLAIALFGCAFFAGSETALMSFSSASMNRVKESGALHKNLFEFWEKFPDRILATIILGNTLFSVASGVISASIANDLVLCTSIPESWLIVAIPLADTLLVLLFGEIIPKILGRIHSDSISPMIIFFLVPATKLLRPIVIASVRIAGVFVRLLGVQPQKEIPTMNVHDLQSMLEAETASEPSLSPRHMLQNILEFGQLKVKDVMLPRNSIFAVDLNQTPKNLMNAVTQTVFSRVPVYKDSLDNIVGIIYAKDLLTDWRTEGLIVVPDLLRPVYFVSQEVPVYELLKEFKKGRHHFAVVRDDAGKVSGIITIEDILEELVGEIYDETKLSLLE